MSREHGPAVGTLAWERAGGPPLTIGQRIGLLGGAARMLLWDLGGRVRGRLRGRARGPRKVDLAAWAPPDSRAARDAEDYLRASSSPALAHHSYRAYYFSAIRYELSGLDVPIDREALYVAALLHDIGLFDRARPPGQRCFTVGGAREARRIAAAASWDAPRADAAAEAIVANLNPRVPLGRFGPEAHVLSLGGEVEVLAQSWRIHPDNVREILARHPRDGFAAGAVPLVRREARAYPGCRFACFGPLFTAVLRRRFREEREDRRASSR
jgi:hypothetical protein